jgi:hypothetical protein
MFKHLIQNEENEKFSLIQLNPTCIIKLNYPLIVRNIYGMYLIINILL